MKSVIKYIEGQPVDMNNMADSVLAFGGTEQCFLCWIPNSIGETMVLCRNNDGTILWIDNRHIPQSQILFRTLETDSKSQILETVGLKNNQPIVNYLSTGSGIALSLHFEDPMRVGSVVGDEMINPIQIRNVNRGRPYKLLCRNRNIDAWGFLDYPTAKDYSIWRVANMEN